MKLKPIYYLPIIVLVALLLFAFFAWLSPSTGDKLTRREEKAVKARIDKQTKWAGGEAVKAKATVEATKPVVAEAKASAARAQTIRLQTHRQSHAQPTTFSDTAVQRIQRQLTSY